VFDLLVPVVAAAAARGGYILDGFPRTLPQVITAADIGARLDLTLGATIYLHVPEEVLVQRLIARGRPDDTPDVIRHRLQVFTDTTSPLIEYYRDRGILVEVSADQPPESDHRPPACFLTAYAGGVSGRVNGSWISNTCWSTSAISSTSLTHISRPGPVAS